MRLNKLDILFFLSHVTYDTKSWGVGFLKEDLEILTIPKAAEYCSVTRMTMWRWVKSGNLRASVTPGGHHRILKEDLETFLREKGMGPMAGKHFPTQRILIVDDDPIIRDVLSRMLSRRRFKTEVAADGFEAGVRLMQFKPNLMILDLMMPGMDGFEVCERVKKDPMTAHIKILVLTGYGRDDYREQVMASGADGFLAKPVHQDEIFQCIGNLIGD